MLTLKNWYIVKWGEEYRAKGVVYGHTSPRCPDGLFIHTSAIKEITESDDKILLKTHNSVYTVFKREVASDLGRSDMMDDYDKNSLPQCFAELNKANGKALAAEIISIAANKQADVMKLGEKLGRNMLYLNISADSSYYFDSAVFKDADGNCLEESYFVHVGMCQDSVLLKKSDVRYFPHQDRNLCFYETLYNWSKDSDKPVGYLHNSGSQPMRVRFTWGKCIELLPDEEVCVDRKIIDALPDSKLTSTEDLYPPQKVKTITTKGSDGIDIVTLLDDE